MKLYKHDDVDVTAINGELRIIHSGTTDDVLTGMIKLFDGTLTYVVDGCYHREDGPAVIRPDGAQFFYLNDDQYTFDDYVEKAGWTDEEIIEWKLTHG